MPRLEPPPERKEREHHGLGLGVFIGALVGLLIGASALLVFELTRRDALEDVRDILREQSNEPASNITNDLRPEVITNETKDLGRPVVITNSTNTTKEEPTNDAFEVESTLPRADATSVPADSEVTLTFSAEMDPVTLSASTISVYENGKNISSSMDYRYRDESMQLTIRFSDASRTFTDGAAVQIIVSREVETTEGEHLEDPFALEFTIEK